MAYVFLIINLSDYFHKLQQHFANLVAPFVMSDDKRYIQTGSGRAVCDVIRLWKNIKYMNESNTGHLINVIINGEWSDKVDAGDILVENPTAEIVGKLIGLLDSNDGYVRNASALALREIGDNTAVSPLLKAIHKKENMNNRGTLVYALENLDCSRHFMTIFALALADSFEVKMSAMDILHEQGFYIDDDDCLKAQSMLDASDIDEEEYEMLRSLLDSLHDEK